MQNHSYGNKFFACERQFILIWPRFEKQPESDSEMGYYSDQSHQGEKANKPIRINSKQIRVTGAKLRKTRASKSQLVLVLLLIG